VRENILYNYVLLPLPFNHESWVATKLAPYFIDECYENRASCRYYDYIEYSFLIQNVLLTAVDTPED
jgi:hypothetical protein